MIWPKTKFSRSFSRFCTTLFFAVAFANLAFASIDTSIPYYGEEFYDAVQSGAHDSSLTKVIKDVLTKKHLRQPGQLDKIVDDCDPMQKGCTFQQKVGYRSARRIILGDLYLVSTKMGPGIEEVYCQREYTRADFKSGEGPGPGVAPDDKVINIEHTWPQSRFNPKMDGEAQKSDLHHLFPSDSEMNRIRGNMRFGEVDQPAFALPCPIAKMGAISGQTGDYFEPPSQHKGNVARALFYFSLRYALAIDPNEEAFLKKWNREDPVNPDEKQRNERIEKIQGNRNPFVDFPELADKISDF